MFEAGRKALVEYEETQHRKILASPTPQKHHGLHMIRVEFAQNEYGYINVDNVKFIATEGADPNKARIYFKHADNVVVEGNVDKLACMLMKLPYNAPKDD